MPRLRRNRGYPPPDDGQPGWYGPPQAGWSGAGGPQQGWQAAAQGGWPQWQGQQWQGQQWPAQQWPAPGYGPSAAQPASAPYPPAWPAGSRHPGGPARYAGDDPEYAAAVAAAEAAEAARVVGGNGHADGLPPGRIKVIERFQGPRLKHRTTLWHRFRALLLLLLVGLVMAGALAAFLALIVWGLSTGVHAATTG